MVQIVTVMLEADVFHEFLWLQGDVEIISEGGELSKY